MKNKKSYQLALIGLLALGSLTQQVKALPMFTAQTGMECAACHTQIMPRLNKFGRTFAASGMTISQKIENMDINPSLLIKSKYSKKWDNPDGEGNLQEEPGAYDGELSPVRMATFTAGGRLTENIGGILNLGWRKDEGDSISGKITYAKEIEDGYWGVTAYSVPGFGPFAGMEFYNTGLYKPLRLFDMRIYSNSAQSTKIGTEASTGLQVYFDKDNFFDGEDHFFVTLGIYTPGQDNGEGIKLSNNILPFARIAYEHPIGDYNIMVGAFAIVGGDYVSDTESTKLKRETYGMDLQLEGTIADKEATLMLTKVFKNKVAYTGSALSDVHNSEDDSFSVEGALSLTPSIVGKVAYMTYNDLVDYGVVGDEKNDVKSIDYAINLGIDYGFVVTGTHMKLAFEYAWMQPKLDRVKEYQSYMVTLTLPF